MAEHLLITHMNVDIEPGACVEDAVNEAIRLAREYRCEVTFEFNGTVVSVDWNSETMSVLGWFVELRRARLRATGGKVDLAGIKWGQE